MHLAGLPHIHNAWIFSIHEQHLNPPIYKLKNEFIKPIIDNHVLLIQENLCILKATGKTCASTNKDINSMSSSQKWMLICSFHIVLIPWPPTIYLWNLLGSKFLLCNYVCTYIVQNWSGLVYLGFKRHIIPH
jgi:ABC-type siderophore export system fused ATPase/permease subunit